MLSPEDLAEIALQHAAGAVPVAQPHRALGQVGRIRRGGRGRGGVGRGRGRVDGRGGKGKGKGGRSRGGRRQTGLRKVNVAGVRST